MQCHPASCLDPAPHHRTRARVRLAKRPCSAIAKAGKSRRPRLRPASAPPARRRVGLKLQPLHGLAHHKNRSSPPLPPPRLGAVSSTDINRHESEFIPGRPRSPPVQPPPRRRHRTANALHPPLRPSLRLRLRLGPQILQIVQIVQSAVRSCLGRHRSDLAGRAVRAGDAAVRRAARVVRVTAGVTELRAG